jgi:hypothetical protein
MDKNLTCQTSHRISGATASGVSSFQSTRVPRQKPPEFHTDFTQNGRSGPHTLRHPGQTSNAQMPMKSQKAAHSAGFHADPPRVAQAKQRAPNQQLANHQSKQRQFFLTVLPTS